MRKDSKILAPSIIKGLEVVLGVGLLAVGLWTGMEIWNALGVVNFPVAVFSVIVIILGVLFLWLAFRRHKGIKSDQNNFCS